MTDTPKHKLGCNTHFIELLQPNSKIISKLPLIFDSSLRRCYAGDGHAER